MLTGVEEPGWHAPLAVGALDEHDGALVRTLAFDDGNCDEHRRLPVDPAAYRALAVHDTFEVGLVRFAAALNTVRSGRLQFCDRRFVCAVAH